MLLLGLELAIGLCLGRGITILVSVSVRVRIQFQFTVRITFGLGIRDRLSVRVSFMVWGGFLLCPRQPRDGSDPQTWPGADRPLAPFPMAFKGKLGASLTLLATATTIALPRGAWAGQGPGCGRPPDLRSGTPFTRLLPPLTGA